MLAVLTALDGPGKPAGLSVHRARARPIERDTLPALAVYRAVPPLGGESETVQRLDHDPGVERAMNVRVEIRVAGEEPDPLIDPIYAWVVRALRADPTLGGLVLDVEEIRSSDDAALLGVPVGACAVDFLITYITSEDDPEEGVAYAS